MAVGTIDIIMQINGSEVVMDLMMLRKVFSESRNIEYTAHCQKRMLERDIYRKDIENCIMKGEIIEDYPLELGNNSVGSYPSCLMLGITLENGHAIHVVVGFNGEKIIVITAYYPDLEHWEADFRIKK